MSALILHGVLAGDAPTPSDAPPHRKVGVGDLRALVSDARGPTPAGEAADTVSAALFHHQVLTAYCQSADVLPVRFGTAFSSVTALTQEVMVTQRQMHEALGRIVGCVEYVVSLTATAPRQPMDPIAVEGRAFLSAKRHQRDDRRTRTARRRALAAELANGLEDRATRTMHLSTKAVDRPLMRKAVLVPRKRIVAFADLMSSYETSADTLDLALRLVGPGPCYSFVDPAASVEPEVCA